MKKYLIDIIGDVFLAHGNEPDLFSGIINELTEKVLEWHKTDTYELINKIFSTKEVKDENKNTHTI